MEQSYVSPSSFSVRGIAVLGIHFIIDELERGAAGGHRAVIVFYK